jgi:hypothetical protein
MTWGTGPDHEEGLIESQGVNAISLEGADPTGTTGGTDPHPEAHDLRPSGILSDELVGLPEQRPGYPGQQRSVETS